MLNKFVLKDDHILYVVSGISASGKTTLAKRISEKLNCKLFSLDSYKEQLYELYGFISEQERLILWNMAKYKFQAEITTTIRNGESVIVEYPFDTSWQEFFNYLSKIYSYTLVIVNCNTRSFEDIWNSRVERDSNNSIRPLCLTARSYIKNKLYEGNGKLNISYMIKKENEYYDGKYTSLCGDFITTDCEFENYLNNM